MTCIAGNAGIFPIFFNSLVCKLSLAYKIVVVAGITVYFFIIQFKLTLILNFNLLAALTLLYLCRQVRAPRKFTDSPKNFIQLINGFSQHQNTRFFFKSF